MKIPGRLGSRFVDPRSGTRSGHPGAGKGAPSLRGLGLVPAKLRRLHCRLRPLRPTRAFKRVRWPKTMWAARSKRPSVWRRPPLSLQPPASPKPAAARESPAPPPRKRRRQKQQQQPLQQQQQTSFLTPQQQQQQQQQPQGPPAPRPVMPPPSRLKSVQKRLAKRLAAAKGTQAARQAHGQGRWTQ